MKGQIICTFSAFYRIEITGLTVIIYSKSLFFEQFTIWIFSIIFLPCLVFVNHNHTVIILNKAVNWVTIIFLQLKHQTINGKLCWSRCEKFVYNYWWMYSNCDCVGKAHRQLLLILFCSTLAPIFAKAPYFFSCRLKLYQFLCLQISKNSYNSEVIRTLEELINLLCLSRTIAKSKLSLWVISCE